MPTFKSLSLYLGLALLFVRSSTSTNSTANTTTSPTDATTSSPNATTSSANATTFSANATTSPTNATTSPTNETTSSTNATTSSTDSTTKSLFDFSLTSDMKAPDFDEPTSALGKQIKFVVKGQKTKNSDFLSLHTNGALNEMGITIKNNSIFVPGDDVKNTQNGFRRTDVLPAIDVNTTMVGTTVFHQSVRLNTKLPLNLKHGYLLSSIEIPVRDHVFDIFTGSDFDSDDKAPLPSNNSRTIRVRDLTTKVLYSTTFEDHKLYNFAIAIDWKANMLTVYASEGNDALKKVAGPVMNDPKVVAADNVLKGEWHVQLIKFPLPDPSTPVDKRGDVPHVGLQEGTTEGVFFSRMSVEDGSGGSITTAVKADGHFGRVKHHGSGSKCRP